MGQDAQKRRGCEVSFDSGPVSARVNELTGTDKFDYHRYLANPDKWFVEFLQKQGLNEEEAMKLKDIFGGIFSALTAPFKGAETELKTAKETKSVSGIVNAVGSYVEAAAQTVEAASKAIKSAGYDIKSEDKHAMAKNMVIAAATSGANKLIDIPGVSEDQEENFFGALFGGILDVLIKAVVAKNNKENSWKL